MYSVIFLGIMHIGHNVLCFQYGKRLPVGFEIPKFKKDYSHILVIQMVKGIKKEKDVMDWGMGVEVMVTGENLDIVGDSTTL